MSGADERQRSEALHLAVQFANVVVESGHPVTSKNIVASAESFAEFLAGEAK